MYHTGNKTKQKKKWIFHLQWSGKNGTYLSLYLSLSFSFSLSLPLSLFKSSDLNDRQKVLIVIWSSDSELNIFFIAKGKGVSYD